MHGEDKAAITSLVTVCVMFLGAEAAVSSGGAESRVRSEEGRREGEEREGG